MRLLAYKSHPAVIFLLSMLLGRKGAIGWFIKNCLLSAYNYSTGSTVVASSFAMLAVYNVFYYLGCWWISKRALAARQG